MDADDEEKFDDRLQQATIDTTIMQQLLSHQIQIVNTSINNYEENNKIFAQNTDRIQYVLKSLQKIMEQNNITDLENKFYNAYHMFQMQRIHVQSETETLQTAVLLAKRDILHSAVLTPHRLLQILGDIKLPPQRIFPLTTSMSERYMDLSNIHTEIKGNNLLFYLSLPLTKDTEYSLFSILPIPSSNDPEFQIFQYISTKFKYLLINPLCTQYNLFNEDCKAATKDIFLCQQSTITNVNYPPNICELQ